METLTSTKLALVSRRARENSKFQFTRLAHLLNVAFLRECYKSLGKEKACGIILLTVTRRGRPTEEPGAGNLHARFCEGR